MEHTDTFEVNGHEVTVLVPEHPNGKWIWKTEFLYAFDEVEKELFRRGYTRIYYSISDRYGSPEAVRLMYACYLELMKRYSLEPKGIFAGFSRGAMYAFNFTLAHPECVSKVHLDAPLLDLRCWPDKTNTELHPGMMKEYGFGSEEEYENYPDYPVEHLGKYLALGIPTLLVVGDCDKVLDWTRNAKLLIEASRSCADPSVLTWYVKVGENHHPHSFGTVGGINMFGTENPVNYRVYGSRYPGSDAEHPVTVPNAVPVILDFFTE